MFLSQERDAVLETGVKWAVRGESGDGLRLDETTAKNAVKKL